MSERELRSANGPGATHATTGVPFLKRCGHKLVTFVYA